MLCSVNAPKKRYSLLELMLLFKASPESYSKGLCPMVAAIVKPDYKAIHTLLFFGASPTSLTLEKGDTPLHAAAQIGLEKELG